MALVRRDLVVVLVWAMAAFTPSGIAQLQFDELPGTLLPPGGDSSEALALADVDGDGDPDLVLGKAGPNALYLNDGTGSFIDATTSHMPDDNDLTRAVAVGDVDGDGDPDLVLGNAGQQTRLYLNDGAGVFTDATAALMPMDRDFTMAVALGDLEGDGDLDLILGNPHMYNRVYLNDGAGAFSEPTPAHIPRDGISTQAMALGDVDGDGDLDLVFATTSSNHLYVNDGRARFTRATDVRLIKRIPRVNERSLAVALGDVDGDGDLDVVFGNFGQNRLYTNDGLGSFTVPITDRLPFLSDLTRAVALGDVDGDGDSDLVFGNSGQNLLYLNDGTGTFTDATAARLPSATDTTLAVVLGDIDGDSDPDLIFRNTGGPDRLYVNLHRQVHAPQPPILSKPFAVDFHAKPGYGTSVHTAIPALSLALAPSPLPLPPLGSLYLDPNAWANLPTVTILATTGRGTLSLAVPADTTLVGQSVYVQALIVNNADPTDTHLTGYTADVIVK